MNLTVAQKLSAVELSQLINSAKDAELTRDIFAPQEIFKPIWSDIESEPNFSHYSDISQAELFRLSGHLLSNYGKSKGLKNYQERAKNHLTLSIELFSKVGLKDQENEAKIILSLCYFYEGAILESDLFLDQIISEYESDYLHPIYLKSQINKLLILHWKSDYQKSIEIIEEIEIPVEFCEDPKIIYLFHSQVGMIYRGIQRYDKAIYHYEKSINIAYELNRLVSVGLTQNNLGFLYKNLKEFKLAHQHIDISISIFREINQTGWLPHALDTKALIYFAEEKYAQSLQTLDEAIELLQQGDDYAVLIDAMWNKIRCYLGLFQQEQAILLFSELTQIAQANIGEVAVKKYTKLFTDLIYIKQNDSLENEVRRFKKVEITNALRQTNFNIEETAKKLQYSTTNKLIKVLNSEFPELYEEIGIQQRTTQPKFKKVKRDSETQVEQIETYNPKFVNQLHLRNVNLEFDAALNIKSSSNIKTFYCSNEKMSEIFDIDFDAVLAVIPFNQIVVNDSVLIKKLLSNEYSLAKIAHDSDFDVFYVADQGVPFSLDEVEIVGKAIAYCSFDEADTDKLFFKPLKIS